MATIEEAIAEIKAGKFIIVVDDESRENEGDLIMAAEKVTPEAINFMAVHARGLICAPMTGERLDELKIPLMVNENTSAHTTAFTVAVEAKHGVTHGYLRRRPRHHHQGTHRPQDPSRGHPRVPATSSPCAPKTAGCWCGRGTPRRPWTWPGWRGSTRPASAAKS